MSYLKLTKLLYLVDRGALLSWGRPVTYDTYVSMDRGPVLSRTLDLITDGAEPGCESHWNDLIAEPEHYEVALVSDEVPLDELSEAEIDLVHETFRLHGHESRWELVELAHELPEWQDPAGSALPIEYRDILAAGKMDDAEAEAIQEELDFLAATDGVLA